jgi:hypothetical protein
MSELKPKDSIINTFKRIGYHHLPEEILEAVYRDAISVTGDGDEDAAGKTTVNAYRDALNIYLDALETNTEELWLRERGLI